MEFPPLFSDVSHDIAGIDVSSNINSINTETVSKIQNDLEPCDMTSMVFLLYDVPLTALQRLIIYQRVTKDVEGYHSDLLLDWAKHAQSDSDHLWRYKFLEALGICQLYGIIRKLGFNVPNVKKHLLLDNVFSLNINPFKKALYRLCEHIDSDIFVKLNRSLNSFHVDIDEYESCELVFLGLICNKFISINVGSPSVEQLSRIVEKFPNLKKFAMDLREIQNKLNKQSQRQTVAKEQLNDSASSTSVFEEHNKNYQSDCDMYDLLQNLNLDDDFMENLEADTKKTKINVQDIYPINNHECLGLCYIINQEKFHPSRESIEDGDIDEPLNDRIGSSRDVEVLTKTMRRFNFNVLVDTNLDSTELLERLKFVVQNEVRKHDSVFMLCILSHGVRGHVYGADSVSVNLDNIQDILDSKYAELILNLPKILLIQACQVDNTKSICAKLLGDSITSRPFHIRKSEFLIYWATAPEFEAFRVGKYGSIFIHVFCKIMDKCTEHEHFLDICTTVNRKMKEICKKLKINQIPQFESRLTNKLYLHLPS